MRIKRLALLSLCWALAQLSLSNVAHAAGGYVYITDVSTLQYQMGADGAVYFRNLNQYNGSVTGCCYAFALDTTTPYGKSAWALILLKMATAGGLYVYVSETNPPTSGNSALVQQVGNWQ